MQESLKIFGHVVSADQEWPNGVVVTNNGKIVWTGPESRLPEDLRERGKSLGIDKGFVLPGLIDLHIHGAGNHDATDATIEALSGMATTLAKFGVTGFLPTTVTHSHKRLLSAAVATRDAMAKQSNHQLQGGAKILGFHLEGPYVQPKKAGAQDPSHIRTINLQELKELDEVSEGNLRLVTLAPEIGDSRKAISWLRSKGVVTSFGHTAVSYEQALDAIYAGVTQSAHTFNAMDPFHHRKPGVVGAVLVSPQVNCEVICDDMHLHQNAVQLVLAAKGPERTVLVSDAIRALGQPNGNYQLGELKVEVCDGKTWLEDGSFGGSVTPLNVGLRNLWKWSGLPLSQAIKCATSVPASILGIPNKGKLASGYDADITIVGPDFQPVVTIAEGRVVFSDGRL